MRGLAQMLIESEVFFAKEFRRIDNLARMQREVLYYVIDGFENRLVIALYPNALREPLRRNILNHLNGFINRCREPGTEGRRVNLAPGSEFRVTVAGIGTTPYGRYDPLPYVSAQVKNQVPDRVTFIRAAPPDLVGGEPFETLLDAVLRLP
jgi:hypothetical protein